MDKNQRHGNNAHTDTPPAIVQNVYSLRRSKSSKNSWFVDVKPNGVYYSLYIYIINWDRQAQKRQQSYEHINSI